MKAKRAAGAALLVFAVLPLPASADGPVFACELTVADARMEVSFEPYPNREMCRTQLDAGRWDLDYGWLMGASGALEIEVVDPTGSLYRVACGVLAGEGFCESRCSVPCGGSEPGLVGPVTVGNASFTLPGIATLVSRVGMYGPLDFCFDPCDYGYYRPLGLEVGCFYVEHHWEYPRSCTS